MFAATQRVQLPFAPYSATPASTLQAQGASAIANQTMAGSTSSAGSPPVIMATIAPFASMFGDWFRIAIFGILLECARRVFSALWAGLVGMFFVTVRFEDDNEAYDWLMVWLSKSNAWSGARELQASTQHSDCYLSSDGNVVAIPDGSGKSSETDKKMIFLPGFGSTHTFFYKGLPMQISRDRTSDGWGHNKESLSLSMFGRDRHAMDQLLLDAQTLYKSRQEKSIVIWQPDMLNMWRRRGTRARRPMSSIILDSEIKDTLLEDARDFLRSGSWYAERGIPFRRGYLLYGAPGSGKTSLIHAIAGALNLDIYVISLSKPGLNDASLNTLICDLPARSIALIEDIDAAFIHGVNRTELDSRHHSPNASPAGYRQWGIAPDATSSVTLSGLLNAIDGIYAQEGRILFATTNRYDVLDPALIRPGRLDMHFEFHNATRQQAEEIFRCFFPSSEEQADVCSPQTSSSGHFLTTAERNALAQVFADAVPSDRCLSMASLQGYLVRYKLEPHAAAKCVGDFVEAERKKQLKDAAKYKVKSKPSSETLVESPNGLGLSSQRDLPSPALTASSLH